tara:strand:+ start:3179 stop:4927 length:1749 start_codon:yes stop_codon:yes gene_type:complete
MADNRKLHHLKGFRVQTGDGPPRPNEGVDGDITIRTTRSGLRLFIKFRNKWYTFGGNGNLGIPGGSNTEQVLSTPDLRPIDSGTKGRGLETFINTKTKNLEMGGNLKLNKGGFINRDGVSNEGLYFGRDLVDRPGQAHFDDDVFMQLGYKLYLSDGDKVAEADGIGNASWIVAPLDTVVQHAVDGNTYLELDATNTRVRLKQKAKIGASGFMTINDNEIDVSSGDLTLDVAGDIIADVAGGQFTITDNSLGDPDLVIQSNSNDAVAGTLSFNKVGRTGVSGDNLGTIAFNGNDAGDNFHNYAFIFGKIDVSTEGQESGILELGVASHDGSSGSDVGLTLTGGSVDTEVDVAIGKGTSSITTIAGNLDIDGGKQTSAGNFEVETTGHFVVDSGNDITLDSNSGNFIAKKAGTEFSAANSAYAGMILGYTRIQDDSTSAGRDFITINSSSMTVLQTVAGTNLSINFKVPPSGNVEISCSFWMSAISDGAEFSLSTGTSYAELDETHTYDADSTIFIDETDHTVHTIIFAVTGLTAGTDTTYYLAGHATGAATYIRHGRFRTGGAHSPPIILKAVALPATIVTGQ